MSTKCTEILLPCCHIFTDLYGKNGAKTFNIEVSYGSIRCGEDPQDFIEVDSDSDFAKIMRHLLNGKTEEELLNILKECK